MQSCLRSSIRSCKDVKVNKYLEYSSKGLYLEILSFLEEVTRIEYYSTFSILNFFSSIFKPLHIIFISNIIYKIKLILLHCIVITKT